MVGPSQLPKRFDRRCQFMINPKVSEGDNDNHTFAPYFPPLGNVMLSIPTLPP